MNINPVVSQELADLAVAENGENTIVDLFQHFDDPTTTGRVATFQLDNNSIGGGVTNVLLFDQEGAGAPATVANFSNYVEDNDYANSIIHRSIPEFIVQGGGFTVNELEIGLVPADEPVVNEFSADRSNLRGTIAMAKLGNDPNSATNQWFFNLADNAANLDNQNGGFTVFGEVISDRDLAAVDAIASLPTINATGADPAFTDLPVVGTNPENPGVDSDANLVRYSNISIDQRPELSFEVLSNSNPELVDVVVAEGELTLDYQEGQSGTADINIRATDLLGDSIEDSFSVTIEPVSATSEGRDIEGSEEDDTIEGGSGDDTIRSGNANDSLFGVAGNDLLNGWNGNDFINGGAGDDLIFGGAGDDLIFGGADNDLINSEVGNDTANGNLGNDLINGGFGSDELAGGAGNDTLKGGARKDSLQGDGGDDLLQGGDWEDELNGGAGNDILEGDRGFDNLNGGAGNDTLIGGTGVDLFTGGADSDLFVLENEQNTNWILDFEAVDKIGLADNIAFEDLAIGGTISTFIGYQGTNLAILPNVTPENITAATFEQF